MLRPASLALASLSLAWCGAVLAALPHHAPNMAASVARDKARSNGSTWRISMSGYGPVTIGMTPARIDAALASLGLSPEAAIGSVGGTTITARDLAVQAVAAGCRPEYMPVLLGIVECVAAPEFRVQDAGSTPGWESMIVVSGPVAIGAGLPEGRDRHIDDARIARLHGLVVEAQPREVPDGDGALEQHAGRRAAREIADAAGVFVQGAGGIAHGDRGQFGAAQVGRRVAHEYPS